MPPPAVSRITMARWINRYTCAKTDAVGHELRSDCSHLSPRRQEWKAATDTPARSQNFDTVVTDAADFRGSAG